MPPPADNLYGWYKPSTATAGVACAVFVALTISHAWRIMRSRQWFGLAIVTGGFCKFQAHPYTQSAGSNDACTVEIIGLAARASSHSNLNAKDPFIIQTLFILLAPILFAASIYMFLGRLIRATAHVELSFIRVNWLSKIFICGDILCFLVQGTGGGVLVGATNAESVSLGQNIILAGLGLQILVFSIFVSCAAVFHSRVILRGLLRTIPPSLCLIPMLMLLYLCSVLIMVRNTYRLVEYRQGQDGYLQSHEWPVYGLDLAFMAVIMAVSLRWYGVDFDNPERVLSLQDFDRP